MAQQFTIGRTATKVTSSKGATYVTYHSTDVVAFDSEAITLDTGGWWTPTTKTRMNQASRQFSLGYIVYQKDFTWYVDKPDGSTATFIDKSLTFSRS